MVGDVTGKGVQAAALTALARYTLRTAARFDPSPAAVVGLLNDVLVHRPESRCSPWRARTSSRAPPARACA